MIKFLLAAVVAVSRIGASQSNDSLWAVSTGGTLSVCENPSSPTSLDTCFSGVPKTYKNSFFVGGDYSSQMTSNGKNVYYYNPGDDSGAGSIVSCPISSLGDGCKSLVGLTGLPPTPPNAMAASIAYLYLGYNIPDNGNIYRCPLASSGVSCVKFNNAGDRPINSLVLANGRLYAGLGKGSTRRTKKGLIWNCNPITANSCDDFNDPGTNSVNELAVGAGYLWAGISNGIIWRCPLDEADSCIIWYGTEAEEAANSISFDDEDGSTFYAGTNNNNPNNPGNGNGGIYKCSADIQGGCKLSPSTNKQVQSVAGGMGSVFWSRVKKDAGPPFIYARFFPSAPFTSSTSKNWAGTQLLYFPGSALTTINVEGTSTFGGRKLMKQDNGNCKERAIEVYDALKRIIEDYSKFLNFIDDEDISCANSKGSVTRGVVKSANECHITINVIAEVRGSESPLEKHIVARVSDAIDKFDVERVEVEPTCKANGGANNGKYDEGTAKGAQNGHGYGVNKDPKASCSFKKKKKQCKKDGLCDWDGTACSDMSSSLMEEQVGNTVNVQPKSAAHQDATKISAIVTGLILIWLGGM